jgi:O-antigen ligase
MHIFRESQISFSQKHIALVVAMFMILFLSGGVPVVRSVTMVVTMLIVLFGMGAVFSWKIHPRFFSAFLAFVLLMAFHYLIFGFSIAFEPYLYLCLSILLALTVLGLTENRRILLQVIDASLMLVCLHAAMSFVLQFLVGDSLVYDISIRALSFKDIVFYNPSKVLGLYRNQGIFWEPGILQFYLNLYLFLSIFVFRRSSTRIAGIIFLIISTFSTTGFIICAFQMLFMLFARKSWKAFFSSLVLVVASTLVFYDVVSENLYSKFQGDSRTSSLGRKYDATTGIRIFLDNPLVGVGFDNARYLEEVQNLGVVEALLDANDLIDRGSTNGIFGLAAQGGLLFTALFGIALYRTMRIYNHAYILAFILVATLLTSPILKTPFIFLFLLQWLLKEGRGEKKSL